MPNIEIIGFRDRSNYIANCVQILLRQKPCANDIIITVHENSRALDLTSGKSQPYLRLVCTPEDDIEEIKELLASLNTDIEIMRLDEFIEAKKSEIG